MKLENKRLELKLHACREPLVPCSYRRLPSSPRRLRHRVTAAGGKECSASSTRNPHSAHGGADRLERVSRRVSGPRHWLKDDSAYLGLEWSEGGKGQEIVRHDPVSGKREVLVPARELVPQGAKGPLHIDDFAISGDGRKLLLFTNTRKVWRLNTRGDYWVFDRDAGSPAQAGWQGFRRPR